MSKKKRSAIQNENGKAKQGGAATVDRSLRVHQRSKIEYELNIRQREDLTEKQKKLIDLILEKETKVVFISGPAGVSKTFVAILAGLMLMNKHSVSDILYIRSVIESASRSLGFLPGLAEDKMEPYLRPMMDKMEEMLPSDQIQQLAKDKRFEGVPVNFLRGASINAKFMIADEAQNFDVKELTTILTRLGKFSKLIVAGDPSQTDLSVNGKSGFLKMFDLFNDEESRNNGIHCFSFTKDDIVRSGILRFIVERLEAKAASEPMFPAKH